MDELTIDMLPIEQAGPIWWQERGDDLSHLEWKMADKFINYSDQIKKQREKFEEMQKVADYQTMLKQAGYYKGEIDGIWGRQTNAAYQQYTNDAKGKGNRLIVSRGDTLSKIANKYGVTVDQIMAINPEIKDRNKIKDDQVINLPSFIRKPSQRTSNSGKQNQKSTKNANSGEELQSNNRNQTDDDILTTFLSERVLSNRTGSKPKDKLYTPATHINGPIPWEENPNAVNIIDAEILKYPYYKKRSLRPPYKEPQTRFPSPSNNTALDRLQSIRKRLEFERSIDKTISKK